MLNLAASLWKVQSPLRLAARIWNYDVKTHDMLIKRINLAQRHRVGNPPQNTPDVWSCWTNPHGRDSGQRHELAHVWPLGSYGTVGGCCSGTKQSANQHKSHYGETFLSHRNILQSFLTTSCRSYLRRSWVKATTDRPLTIFTGEMSVFEHFTALRGENKVVQVQNIYRNSYFK